MTPPFDEAIEAIARAGYHNHRLETHSDAVSTALFSDLVKHCPPLRQDVKNGTVKVWKNVRAPGDRLRKIDLFVGEPAASGELDIQRVRSALESKSVITAHRKSWQPLRRSSKSFGSDSRGSPRGASYCDRSHRSCPAGAKHPRSGSSVL